jgi:MGT family glycosyltransferase
MKKAHIAFISFPHPPHVNPTLPIVSVLVRRGHRVTYVTSDLFSSRVAELGAEIVSCPRFRVDSLWQGVDEKERYQHPFCGLAIQTLGEMTRFYEDDKPDLMIYDLNAFAGRIFSNRRNIPAIQTSPTFAHDKENWSQQVKDPEFRKGLLAESKKADNFLEHYGIAASDFLFHREKLNVYLFPKALQPKGNVFGEDCFYAGRCAGEQPYYGEWQKRDTEGKPIVLVATSTTYLQGPEFFKMCIDAFSGLQWHVILSIGDSGDAKSLMPLPPHFELIQHTSHIKILPHASLYVCLGGIITSAEAIYHGLPLIVTTHGFPELEWQADNIESLGIGVHVRKADTNAEHLRALAIQVSENHELLDKVRQIRRAVQREPGAEETANRIEEYLGLC